MHETERLPITKNWLVIATAAILAAFGVGLLGYAWLGSTTHYMADDYWTAWATRTYPFWQLPGYWYLNWSGRFSFSFFISLAEVFGTVIVPFLPLLGLASLTAGTALLVRKGMQLLPARMPGLIAWSISAVLVFCTVHSTQNVLQSLYWQTGILTYFIPIVFFVFYLGLILGQALQPEKKLSWPVLAASAILAFVNGGFSETSVAIQVTALALALMVSLVSPSGTLRRRLAPWLAAGLAASLLAMLVIILAPGNGLRLAAGQLTPGQSASGALTLDLVYLLKTSITSAVSYLITTIRTHLPDTAAALLLPGLFAWFTALPLPAQQKPSMVKGLSTGLIAIPVVVFILVLSGHVPAYFVMHSGPPIRTEIIFQAILTFGVGAWGFIAGTLVRYVSALSASDERLAGLVACLIVFLLLVLEPGRFYLKAIGQYPVLYSYAQQWTTRDQSLREAARQGKKTATVNTIGQLDQTLGDLRAEPDFWINQRAAQYYGLDAIIAK